MIDKTMICPRDGRIIDIVSITDNKMDFIKNEIEIGIKTVECPTCKISWKLITSCIGTLN
jgi:hypothetical protein